MQIEMPRNGSPEDRGAADYWYNFPREPHYYELGSYKSPRIDASEMTAKQVAAYNRGYDLAEEQGDQKDQD